MRADETVRLKFIFSSNFHQSKTGFLLLYSNGALFSKVIAYVEKITSFPL